MLLTPQVGQNMKASLTKTPLPLGSTPSRVRWASFWIPGLWPKGVRATGMEKRLRHWTTMSPFLSILRVAESFAFCTKEMFNIFVSSTVRCKTRGSARTVKGTIGSVEIRNRGMHLAKEIFCSFCRVITSPPVYQSECCLARFGPVKQKPGR